MGLVVEGETEYGALPALLSRLNVRCTAPSCLHGQPVELPARALARDHLLSYVIVQLRKKPDKVLVVLDAEGRTHSLREFAATLKRELQEQVRKHEGAKLAERVTVVFCNRRFENWLLSDPGGICRSTYIERDLSGRVKCHADERDALALIKSVFRKGTAYRKAVHGPRLAELVRVEDKNVRQCSGSLRKFVRLVLGARRVGP